MLYDVFPLHIIYFYCSVLLFYRVIFNKVTYFLGVIYRHINTLNIQGVIKYKLLQ